MDAILRSMPEGMPIARDLEPSPPIDYASARLNDDVPSTPPPRWLIRGLAGGVLLVLTLHVLTHCIEFWQDRTSPLPTDWARRSLDQYLTYWLPIALHAAAWVIACQTLVTSRAARLLGYLLLCVFSLHVLLAVWEYGFSLIKHGQSIGMSINASADILRFLPLGAVGFVLARVIGPGVTDRRVRLFTTIVTTTVLISVGLQLAWELLHASGPFYKFDQYIQPIGHALLLLWVGQLTCYGWLISLTIQALVLRRTLGTAVTVLSIAAVAEVILTFLVLSPWLKQASAPDPDWLFSALWTFTVATALSQPTQMLLLAFALFAAGRLSRDPSPHPLTTPPPADLSPDRFPVVDPRR